MHSNSKKRKALAARVYEISVVALEPLKGKAEASIPDAFKTGLEHLAR
jgi:hypothetical protein